MENYLTVVDVLNLPSKKGRGNLDVHSPVASSDPFFNRQDVTVNDISDTSHWG